MSHPTSTAGTWTGMLLTSAEIAALDAAARAGIRNIPPTASVKSDLRALVARIQAATPDGRTTA